MTFIYVILIGGFLAYWVGTLLDKPTKKKVQTKVPTDKLITQAKDMTSKAEAMIQANLSGHQMVADAINTGSYTGPLPEKRSDGGWLSIFDNLRILKIAGINHRNDIGQYTGRVDCALVPEPTNEFDPDAIKVVAEDSHHLGYIPSDQTDFVRSMTACEFPYRCTAFIHEHEDEDDGHKFYTGFVYIKRLD
ncbi:MAG: HIRAN domain-containing protein [Bacteroidaceae bacterium]|nr:HIRAN domain-containing protein [Bacteroidaceae bacterium]